MWLARSSLKARAGASGFSEELAQTLVSQKPYISSHKKGHVGTNSRGCRLVQPAWNSLGAAEKKAPNSKGRARLSLLV